AVIVVLLPWILRKIEVPAPRVEASVDYDAANRALQSQIDAVRRTLQGNVVRPHPFRRALNRCREYRSETRRDRIELLGLGFHWPNASLTHELENTLGYNPLRLGDYSRATGAEDHVGHREALAPGFRRENQRLRRPSRRVPNAKFLSRAASLAIARSG
ncbi:MAG: hypothetical protein HC845_08515, partial [Akkermansiaceae bacterium]|nr:hypothetical protein [Akkermansiaceae bacterium]